MSSDKNLDGRKRTPGRPRIEGRAEVRLGELLPAVTAFTSHKKLGERGRAEALRILVQDGLATNGFDPDTPDYWPTSGRAVNRDDQ